MIFSISGPQGQGKTTVLNTLKDRGYKVAEQKTSRSILSEWGMTLNEVNKYAPLTKKFQEEIIERHFASVQPHIDSDEVVLIERSFADIFNYATFAIGSFNEYSEWMDRYWERCCEYQSKFACVFYLTGRAITPEDDGVRSANKHFARAVDVVIRNNLEEMRNLGCRMYVVDTPAHDTRIDIISDVILALSADNY